MWLGEIIDIGSGKLPFGFGYGGERSCGFLHGWDRQISGDTVKYFEDKKNGGLVVTAKLKAYEKWPAFDLQITLENTGTADTKTIEGFSTLCFEVASPPEGGAYVVHKAMGGLSTPEDFVQGDAVIGAGGKFTLETAGGRSSNKDLPFFRIDTGRGNIIVAVGWTGQWKCELENADGVLSVSAGMADSHFVMHPGEKFGLGSMVALFWEGDPYESNNAFRQLVLEEYVPEVKGRGGLSPYIFCNTCFTRGGGWLNECDEQNQISLINALKPLSCESVITDAGWFVGGWPMGAGNWDPDPEKYPGGLKPVSEAAIRHGMKYGLWFELERVVSGTELANRHTDWLLRSGGNSGIPLENEHMLLNLGIPEAVDYIYAIVENKFKNDRIECYRQDFNVDPLVYWQKNDAPDRVGVTEIKYINGLYGYLDKIRANYPEVFMDGCSSGGRRIDIEMVKRFHTHQKTDLWFNPTVDQNSLFSLSHYLPNVSFTAHINRYDDYAFDSVSAATLCLGWIADSDEQYNQNGKFEATRADELMERYKTTRRYLNRSFYPLTPPDAKDDAAIAFQFCDGNSGVVFIFAREKCEKSSLILALKGIDGGLRYALTDLASGEVTEIKASGFSVGIDKVPFSRVFKFEALGV